MVESGRLQTTVKCGACPLSAGLTKATDTHWEYVIISVLHDKSGYRNEHQIYAYTILSVLLEHYMMAKNVRNTILFIVNKRKNLL